MAMGKAKAILKGIWAFCSYLFVPQRRPRPIEVSVNSKTNNMIIKRFEVFPKKNEDKILEECGYSESTQLFELQPYYRGDENLAFLFTEDSSEFGFNWIDKPNVFSQKVYESYNYKSTLVETIKDKRIAVFLCVNKVYQFFGVYQLTNPFVTPGGIGMVVDVETPLTFRLEKEDFVIER